MIEELSMEDNERRRLLLAEIAKLQWRFATEFGGRYSYFPVEGSSGRKRLWILAAWIGIFSVGPLMLLKDQFPWAVFVVICVGAAVAGVVDALDPAKVRLSRSADVDKFQFPQAWIQGKFKPEWDKTHSFIILPVMSELEEDWLLARRLCKTTVQVKWVRVLFTLRWIITSMELFGILLSRLFGVGKRRKRLVLEAEDRH